MIRFIIPIIVILAVNALTVFLSKRSFGDTMPISFMGLTILLFLSQLILNTYYVGLFITAIAGIAGFVVLFMKKDIRTKYFTNGFIAFVGCCIFAIVWDYNRTFTDFDEFWHWGLMIKESLRLDSFHCVDASNMFVHKDYPPFLPILELVWSKFANIYSEGLITSGLHIFCFSMVVPYAAEQICGNKVATEKGKIIQDVIVIACFSAIFLVVCETFDRARIFNTILADFPLGVTFGYCLFLIISEKSLNDGFDFFALVLGMISLILIKQVGLAYYLVVIAMFALLSVICQKSKDSEKRWLDTIIRVLILVIVPLLFYLLWTSYLKTCSISDIRASAGESGQFDLAKVNLQEYFASITEGEGLKHSTFMNVLSAFMKRDIANIKWLPISYIGFYLALVVILIALAKYYKNRLSVKKAVAMGTVYTIGSIGYAFMLSVLFMFCFTTDEMIELRGYERYISSFVIGELISLGLLFVMLQSERSSEYAKVEGIKLWKPILCTLAIIVILGIKNMGYLLPQQIIRRMDMSKLTEATEFIQRKTEPNSTISLVYDVNDNISGMSWYGGVQSYLQYCVNDRKLLWGSDLYGLDYTTDSGRQAAKSQIDKSDYLYFMSLNDNLEEAFSSVVSGGKLETPQIYKVIRNGEKIVLEKGD